MRTALKQHFISTEESEARQDSKPVWAGSILYLSSVPESYSVLFFLLIARGWEDGL